ncbi:MAG: Crp/Fnr family transcriptional regulator [Chloroflexota bacterium]
MVSTRIKHRVSPREEKYDYLREVDIFQDLTNREIEEISEMTRMCLYSSNHIFYMPDDPGEVLFIIKQGRVQLYRISPDGRKLVFATLNQGAIFGHMGMIGQRMHNTFAESVGNCKICIMNRQDVEELLMAKPIIALRFLENVGNRLVDAEQRFEDIAFRRMPSRIARLILQLTEEQGDGATLKGYTHQQIADMLGTYRETTTQILNDFKNQGLIRLGRKTIEIVDYDGLVDVAADD